MVKPVATNMTITLQQSGESGASVKPLVIGEQMVVHANVATPVAMPILPHQPVALEQDRLPQNRLPQAAATLSENMAGLSLDRSADRTKLDDFTGQQVDLFYRRYTIKKDN